MNKKKWVVDEGAAKVVRIIFTNGVLNLLPSKSFRHNMNHSRQKSGSLLFRGNERLRTEPDGNMS